MTVKGFIKKYFWWLGIFLGGSLLVWGSYRLTDKFLRDQRRLMSYQPPAVKNDLRRTPSSKEPVRKVYTQKELEEARRRGDIPKTMAQPYIPPAQNPNDAAIQRTMRTIDEINRMNQMNQRLMDQQRRTNTK